MWEVNKEDAPRLLRPHLPLWLPAVLCWRSAPQSGWIHLHRPNWSFCPQDRCSQKSSLLLSGGISPWAAATDLSVWLGLYTEQIWARLCTDGDEQSLILQVTLNMLTRWHVWMYMINMKHWCLRTLCSVHSVPHPWSSAYRQRTVSLLPPSGQKGVNGDSRIPKKDARMN